ncbi:hypothetical protein MLD52_22395, partial [Puniceicoccaceae bacterium K14]|nr:hypothetical protein [Puniceicoccaceae bacterium K14]
FLELHAVSFVLLHILILSYRESPVHYSQGASNQPSGRISENLSITCCAKKMTKLITIFICLFCLASISADSSDRIIGIYQDKEKNEFFDWSGFWFGYGFSNEHGERVMIYYGPNKKEIEREKEAGELPLGSIEDSGVFFGKDALKELREIDYESELASQILDTIERERPDINADHNPLGKIREKINQHNQRAETTSASARRLCLA